ncbi:MAG: hypothetical protein ACK5Z2_00165 [Bacteroidota bacterium]|jgi:hypothetical protein
MAKIAFNTSGITDYVQSGYLHLMAAGSDGNDGSSTGIHLRWGLQHNLGDKHLPKGNLSVSGNYSTSIAYNKANDNVSIYRSSYATNSYRTEVDLNTIPDVINDSASVREWQYTGIQPVAAVPTIQNTITLRFKDIAQYDYVLGNFDPSTDPRGFIQNYFGIIEASVDSKLFFSVKIGLRYTENSAGSYFRSEGISTPDTYDAGVQILSCRKTETNSNTTEIELRGENLNHIRFSHCSFYPDVLKFQCYYDYIIGTNEASTPGNWTKVDDFALTINNNDANRRLENTAIFQVDEEWPRFYGRNTNTGAYTVSVANYQDKWLPASSPASGIKAAVIGYLDKSRTDVFALDSLAADNVDDNSHYDISYLQMLKLMSLDFHLARMLGHGHIDKVTESIQFIYVAVYGTLKDPADETQTLATYHAFMSLPTSKTNYRLPKTPEINSISYGLSVSNGTGTPTQLSDANGYALYDDVRFVNINKGEYPYEKAPGVFYETAEEFFLADITKPVLYGIKYKENTESAWDNPEISSDSEYQDAAGIDEVIPFPETGTPLFTHQETEAGTHDYAVYGINLFSRVSGLSNTATTDETVFLKRNTLQPPSNFKVQLVQKENVPLLTTAFEQNPLLVSILGSDKTLVRATFEWDEVHNIAYQAADKVDLFFCDHTPLMVRGVISSVSNLSNNRAQVQLGSLIINSSNPVQTIIPTISAGDVLKFAGSQLAAGQQLFEVESVTTSGNTPVLVLKKTRQTTSQEYPIGSNQFITTETYIAPSTGDMVTVVENMQQIANWTTHLTKQVNLIGFSPLHTETITMADGSQKTLMIGGKYATATISQEFHISAPNTPTGVYRITYLNYTLPAHSDSDVSWYKGSVRVPSATTPEVMKKLEVWEIKNNNGNLELLVFDPDFANDPIVFGSNTNRTNVYVNFHPGYKVYLYKDDQNGNNFTATAILPSTGYSSKITYMGIRSMDTSQTPDLCSLISIPSPLIAREIVEPLAPAALNGPTYATRPDFYGKSTYTFDVQLDTTGGRVPFGLQILRGNDRLILGTLYKAETLTGTTTISGVLQQLAGLTGDDAAYYDQRILDVLNGNINTITGTFLAYGNGSYVLPDPDNDELELPDPGNPTEMITPFDGSYTLSDLVSGGLLQSAIAQVFLPLTEQPVIFRYLKEGRKTSSRKPLYRDENGQLITPVLPSDPNYDPNEYDPFPMAVTYADSGNTFVRFTDYTLDGAANNIYFYYAVEFSDISTFSPRSPILGAIHLVNAAPAEAPQIKKVISQRFNIEAETVTAVLFEINPYLPSEGIGEYQIYRTINAAEAQSVRTMQHVKTISAGYDLIDDFTDVPFPLFGEALLYRIVAVRFTKDENGNLLKVPSKPSNLAMTNVIDVQNPEAPKLRSVNGTTTTTELQNVQLQWPTTCYNGKYMLQKQNPAGDWIEIYRETSNAAGLQYPPLDQSNQPDFTNFPETAALARINSFGEKIRHTYRVVVENSSGLLNLEQTELALDQGNGDLLWYDSFVSYRDNNGYIQEKLSGGDVTYQSLQQPGGMLFTSIIDPLPVGHNSFTSITIKVTDDLNNSSTKTITSITGTATFNHGDGGLAMDNSNPNRTYTIKTTLLTSGASTGVTKTYKLAYVAGACYDLSNLEHLISYNDSNNTTLNPIVSGEVDSGYTYPGAITINDISNLASINQTFDELEVTILDGSGNSLTKTLTTVNGSLSFSDGEGGIILNSSNPNPEIIIFTNLRSNECLTPISKTYRLKYVYSPCNSLPNLTNIVSFSDGNNVSLSPLSTTQIAQYNHPGGSIEIIETISSSLPVGMLLDKIDVVLQDSSGAYFIKQITSPSGNVTFSDGEGGLSLQNNSSNEFSVSLIVKTDICTATYSYIINYGN